MVGFFLFSFLYLPEEDEIYTGTVADPSAINPLIHRKHLGERKPYLRTQQGDMDVLNEPHFVASSADSSHVYFWFREISTKSSPCGKGVYARVARVCRKDMGGSRSYSHEWTSFIKARLTCSVPGAFPFMFDELQAATVVNMPKGGQMVYGIFTTPWEGLHATAVCAYRMEDVAAAFNYAPFDPPHDYKTPLGKRSAVKPGSCTPNSKLLKDHVVSYLLKHTMLDTPVQNFFREPLFVDTSMDAKFTKIAVEPGVEAVSGQMYNILYLGTADGRVLKSVNVAPKRMHGAVQPVLIEILSTSRPPVKRSPSYHPQSGPHPSTHPRATDPIRDIRLQGAQVLVVTDRAVRAVPKHHCSNASTCAGCVRLQDPHCAWDMGQARCAHRPVLGWDAAVHIQELYSGVSPHCPAGEEESQLYYIDNLYPQPASVMSTARVFQTRDLAIAVCASLVCAIVIGFIAGYFIRYRFTNPFIRSTNSSVTYDSTCNHSTLLGGHHHKSSLQNQLDVYGTPPQHTKLNEAVSLILSMHESTGKTSPEKNMNANVIGVPPILNNGTLPKEYRVKKVYV